MNKRGFLGNLIGAFIIILVGFTLAPTIEDTIFSRVSNETGAASTTLSLISVVFPIAIIVAAIGVAVQGLRSAGLLGEFKEEYEEYQIKEEAKEKPHKQTYIEFVREQVEAERLIHKSNSMWRMFWR